MSFFNHRAPSTRPLYPRPVDHHATTPPVVHTSPSPSQAPIVSSPAYPHTGRLEAGSTATTDSLEYIMQQARYWQGEAIRNGNRAIELAAVINHAETIRLVARRFLSSYADLRRVARAIEQMRPDTSLPLHIQAGDLLELIRALDLESEGN